MENLDSIKKIVREILEVDEKARNSDKWLIIETLRRMGFKIYVDYKELDAMPSWETIRRTRQLLQAENNNLRASEEIEQIRNKRREEFKEYFGHPTNETINQPMRTKGIEIKTIVNEKGRVIF